MCVIGFIYNLGLTIKPIKGPPLGVSACPHNKKLATLRNNELCVCVCVCVPLPYPFQKSWCRRSPTPGASTAASLEADGVQVSFLWTKGHLDKFESTKDMMCAKLNG
eukprot:COSAG01_NODE_27586_length_681_cov_155.855670_2_plen_106_part_01